MKKLLAILLVGFTLPTAAANLKQPTILLLMAEDMSSRVGAFGDPVAVTPSLDALATQGVRYTNTFTTAGVCAPSRAAHILGMHQISTGTQHMRTGRLGYLSVPPAEVKAYPELLRTAGYYTFTDEKLDYQFSGARAGTGPFTIWDTENTRDWSGRDQQQPFFGLVNFQVTHETGVFTPLGTMPHSRTHFMVQLMRWWMLDSVETGVVKPEAVKLEPYYPDTPVVREDIARHYDNIAQMDREVGQILQRLEDEGLAGSTIVIWTTDHGDGLPRAKRELHDSGIKVPMIIRWPEAYRPEAVKPGQVDSRLLSFVDLAPTVLKLAGVTLPRYLHGSNFTNPDTPERQYIYASRDRIDEVPDRQRAVRDARFKYIRSWYPELPEGHPLAFRDNINMVIEMRSLYNHGQLNQAQRLWFEPSGSERLYDLQNDPYELVDISKDPAHVAELTRLRAALDERLAQIGDWSDIDESAMLEDFAPRGERQVTAAPTIEVANGVLIATEASKGSSIGYRVDDGNWQLYTGPADVSGAGQVEVKAVRYGWSESSIVQH